MTSPSCPNEACIQSIGSPAKVVLHGFFRVRCGRRRRFRCRGCGRTFSARTNTPCFGLGCSWPAFERVAHMSVEGISCAAIARVEGIAWHTADRCVGQSSRACSTVQRTPHLWDTSRRASSRRAANVCALQSKALLGFHKHGSVRTAVVFNGRRAAQLREYKSLVQ